VAKEEGSRGGRRPRAEARPGDPARQDGKRGRRRTREDAQPGEIANEEARAGGGRRRRKDARPGEIIEAGLRAFAENGFDRTRLEDVAKRAGIAKGTIYLYFDNKEALFQAAVRSRVLPALDAVAALVDQYPGPTEELLRLVFKTLYERLVASDLPVLMRIIIAEGERFPDIPAYYYRETITKAQTLLGKIVARGIARGEFREGAATAVPIVLVAPALVAAIWRLTFEPHQHLDLDKMLAAHADLVFHGILRHGD